MTTQTDPTTTTTPTDERPTLLRAVQDTPTSLWNDSADLAELAASIEFGAVGATCNPVIAYTVIKNDLDTWAPRLREIADANPTAGESEIGWLAVEQLSIEAAALLEAEFEASGGRNGRLSMQTDPRLHRDAAALPVENRIDVPVDPRVLESLAAGIPEEWHRAYDVDGMSLDEFERFGATVRTLRQFLEADAQLDALVRDVIVPAI